jgi:hypothetical protein
MCEYSKLTNLKGRGGHTACCGCNLRIGQYGEMALRLGHLPFSVLPSLHQAFGE